MGEEDPRLAPALAALADPTRRAVLALLARQPQRAGELAQALSMAPPSLSRHLRVLRRSGGDDAGADAGRGNLSGDVSRGVATGLRRW